MHVFYPEVAAIVAAHLPLDAEAISNSLVPPPNAAMGDIAFPCFSLAKGLRKAPSAIAANLAASLRSAGLTAPLADVRADGPYLNLFLDRPFAGAALIERAHAEHWGSSGSGAGRTVVIDFSSPNIAKPMHLGHLRSTVIGNSLIKIYRHQGWCAVGINHLGDWGTQFGKLMAAYFRWGNPERVRSNPIDELLALYQLFTDRLKEQPELEAEARTYFKRLEDGDPAIRALWRFIVDESIKEVSRIYDLLQVHFDAFTGESAYEEQMPVVIAELRAKGLLTESQGAQVVPLAEYDLPPCLIIKEDGASIYATRDLAAAEWRRQQYRADRMLYVVDQGQSVHFRQVFAVLTKAGHAWAEQCRHVGFGVLRVEGRRLRTRSGDVIYLEDLLNRSIDLAREIIAEKNPSLPDREQVARSVGVGAVIFNDLRQNRISDIDFRWEEALSFAGQTGAYLQYTCARAGKLLRDAGGALTPSVSPVYAEEQEWAVLRELGRFPEAVARAEEQMEPSAVAQYLLDVAQAFNRFYHDRPILKAEPDVRRARLALVKATANTLHIGLGLLGIEAPEQM
ncbi:MAG TPA: arginine--tRNA ligase [Symbiobacteriaceae bacterium]|nr:arginine--tRNA ligase [Symbiobacteriaceae bacterium]